MSDTESSPPKSGDYQDGKLWFSRRGSTLTLGLTSRAVEDIGEVESVEYPEDGDDFEKGDAVLTVNGTNGVMDVVTPATGTVKEANESVKAEPDIVSEDPLEEGWLIKLEIEDPTELEAV